MLKMNTVIKYKLVAKKNTSANEKYKLGHALHS